MKWEPDGMKSRSPHYVNKYNCNYHLCDILITSQIECQPDHDSISSRRALKAPDASYHELTDSTACAL